MSGWPEVLPASPSPSQHRGMSLSPACHPTSLKPHGSDSWDSRAPGNPAPPGSLRGRKSSSPPPSHISGPQGQQHMLLPSEGEKLLHGSFPSSPAAQGVCMPPFWGGLRVITGPTQACQQASPMGQTRAERKKNKGGGWKWYSLEVH